MSLPLLITVIIRDKVALHFPCNQHKNGILRIRLHVPEEMHIHQSGTVRQSAEFNLQNVSLTWLQRGGLVAFEAYTHRESIVIVPRSSTSRCHSPTGIALCNGKSQHTTHLVLKYQLVLSKYFHVFKKKSSVNSRGNGVRISCSGTCFAEHLPYDFVRTQSQFGPRTGISR